MIKLKGADVKLNLQGNICLHSLKNRILIVSAAPLFRVDKHQEFTWTTTNNIQDIDNFIECPSVYIEIMKIELRSSP